MSEYTKPKFFRKESSVESEHKIPKKKLLIAFAFALALSVVILIFTQNLFGSGAALGNVEFTPLSAEEIPRTIEKDVIPEYRDLERALGCLIDGKVYIVVTRGEKPTAGYELAIEKLKLEKNKDGSNLTVTALFTDPSADKTVSRIITYPYAVAVTELESLPDTIELNVRYS